MSDRLYKRGIEITLTKPTAFFEQDPSNQIVIQNLRARFAIVKNLQSEPNTCDITITNLAPETRTALQAKPLHVRIDAGYDDDLSMLFVGDLIWAESKRKGTDWETKLSIGDGTRARGAQMSRTFRSGVDPRTVIADVAKSMGLTIPTNLKEARAFASNLTSGVVADGPSPEQLTKMLAPKGYGWSVQDGTLQVLADGETVPGTALVISKDTGMVGSPEYGAPKEDGKPPILTVVALLKPELRCGAQISVQSIAVNGLFKALKVSHEGDTAGKSWYSTVEAIAT